MYKNQRIKRWCFDVELIYLAQELHIPIAEVPVQWREVPGMLNVVGFVFNTPLVTQTAKAHILLPTFV